MWDIAVAKPSKYDTLIAHKMCTGVVFISYRCESFVWNEVILHLSFHKFWKGLGLKTGYKFTEFMVFIIEKGRI